jgi:hypothetical protein
MCVLAYVILTILATEQMGADFECFWGVFTCDPYHVE